MSFYPSFFLLDLLVASLPNANFNRRSPSQRHQPLAHQLSLLCHPLELASIRAYRRNWPSLSLPEPHRPEQRSLLPSGVALSVTRALTFLNPFLYLVNLFTDIQRYSSQVGDETISIRKSIFDGCGVLTVALLWRQSLSRRSGGDYGLPHNLLQGYFFSGILPVHETDTGGSTRSKTQQLKP